MFFRRTRNRWFREMLSKKEKKTARYWLAIGRVSHRGRAWRDLRFESSKLILICADFLMNVFVRSISLRLEKKELNSTLLISIKGIHKLNSGFWDSLFFFLEVKQSQRKVTLRSFSLKDNSVVLPSFFYVYRHDPHFSPIWPTIFISNGMFESIWDD